MTDRDAFLRAICAEPREDTPRLAYADWLDENGRGPHAAFIRSDIAMSLRDEWDAERVRWETDLVPNVLRPQPWFAAAFPEPHPVLSYLWGGPVLTRRGFRWAAKVSLGSAAPFRTGAADLFAAHPIERLDFFDHAPGLAWLLDQPWFPRLTGLGWTAGRCSGAALRPLLKAAPLHLTDLDLTSHALNPDGMRALGASAVFRNLERLELYGVGPRVVAAALEALAASGALRLRTLKIGFDSLRTSAAALAANLPPALRVLNVAGTSLHSAGTHDLVAALGTSDLRMLDLATNGIGNDGAAAVFTSPRLAGLKVLSLKHCLVGDEALRVLLDSSPLADTLDLLDLSAAAASADTRQAVKDRMGDRVRF